MVRKHFFYLILPVEITRKTLMLKNKIMSRTSHRYAVNLRERCKVWKLYFLPTSVLLVKFSALIPSVPLASGDGSLNQEEVIFRSV